MVVRTVSLLDVDPDLADHLARPCSDAARASIAIRVATLPSGVVAPAELIESESATYGLLVLAGLLDRRITLEETCASHLVGPGDVVAAAWDAPYEATLPATIDWVAMGAVDVGLLDGPFITAAGRWPELLGAMIMRAGRQAASVGLRSAILQLPRVEDRIHALMRYLAGRWGRVTPAGVVVPVLLTHAMIGRLIGARRPTVSLALRLLEAQGTVHRAEMGWLLPHGTASAEDPPAPLAVG